MRLVLAGRGSLQRVLRTTAAGRRSHRDGPGGGTYVPYRCGLIFESRMISEWWARYPKLAAYPDEVQAMVLQAQLQRAGPGS